MFCDIRHWRAGAGWIDIPDIFTGFTQQIAPAQVIGKIYTCFLARICVADDGYATDIGQVQ